MKKPVVMISSVSAKLAMIAAVREAFNKLQPDALIVGADANPEATGRGYVDRFIEMPRIEHIHVTDFIESLQSHGVTHIIPSRDGELLFYSRHAEQLKVAGISVMVSSVTAIENCLDKYAFYTNFGELFPIIRTGLTTSANVTRWVVKERFGAASSGILLDLDTAQAKAQSCQLKNAIYQPYFDGQEYSVDLFITQDNLCNGYVVRSRDVVVAGESKVTTSHDRPDIGELAVSLALAIGLVGHCLVQVIEDASQELHIVEINPRYGGASGLSVSLGLDSFYWFALESCGQTVEGKRLHAYPANETLNTLSDQHEKWVHED